MDSHDYLEDDLQRKEKRDSRHDRKKLRAKDRSKYKKTDQDQQKKLEQGIIPKEHNFERGRVLSINGENITVESEGKLVTCVLRGSLKKDRQRIKNLIIVGDFVLFSSSSAGEGLIEEVEPRRTVLSRADNLSRQKEHLIAANIDLVLITVSVVQPVLKTPIIDRYVIAAEKGGMDYLVIVNKIDLLEADSFEAEVEKELYEDAIQAYSIANIPFLGVSTVTNEGLAELKKAMQGRASVFSGQSGVGKSSLINAITGSSLLTREGVERTGKGSHTTTTAQLLPLEGSGWVIDTPGIRSFGLWNLCSEDIAAYFDEFTPFAAQCKFANCTHTHEENCAVLKAVEAGQIHPLRYDSYQALIAQLQEIHLRR